jgi:5-methylcytosine-specific restriction protein B
MNIQNHAEQVLRLLRKNNNVLLIGPPGSGKSKLMEIVAQTFLGVPAPAIKPASPVPLPPTGRQLPSWIPSSARSKREIFAMTFHQGTKHRDFVSGIVPALTAGSTGFCVTDGVLMKANLFATTQHGSALVIIDEINRGPAVSIFGDTLTAIEADKRLAEDDSKTPASAPFHAYDSSSGQMKPFHLSSHLYILASMNEADTSVEPLDVAFLRRFAVYRLEPDEALIRDYFGLLPGTVKAGEPPELNTLLTSLVEAWKAVNERISIGRSPAFQLGHGVLMGASRPADLAAAQAFAADCWRRIETHVREVFFGNDTSQAIVLNASADGSYYKLNEATFDDQPVYRLAFKDWKNDEIGAVLKAVISNAS